ncbi:MAG: gliding motility-associated C-terminal domain-containing protein [Flavobacteriales bacterium]|nr:gliding motility-associated C-terminal domain-containing protein [Flavobacteriales bacterium]
MKIYKHKYWKGLSFLVMLVLCCSITQAQNTLVLNGGITVLNGGTAGTQVYLVVNESNTAGITRLAGGGHIHSENQYNFVKWISGTGTGNYVFPFGVGGNAADYIPFTFDKTSAGSSNIDMSTWQTNIPNMPHPAATNVGAVTSMTGTADSIVSALDRFWDIQTSAATTADLTFSYLGIENTTASPLDTVKAQHWNGAAWDPQVGVGNLGVVAGVGTAGPFIGQTTFSPWILSIFSPCPTAIISYPNSYCDNDTASQAIIFAGGLGGLFSASPAGLAIDTLTGAVIPANSTAGTYTVTYTLDSTAICPIYTTTTTITINPTASTNTTAAICQGDSIMLGGVFQNTAGIYNDTLSTSLGCDSVIVTTLTVNPINTTQVTDAICQGQSIMLGGLLQTTAGVYYDTLTTSLGCDSILETTLSVNPLPVIIASADDTICPGLVANISASGGVSYNWDNGLGAGQNQSVSPLVSTTYVVTGTDANGCQNTDTVNVMVEPGTIADAGLDQELCDDVLAFTLGGNTPLVLGETGLWTTTSSAVIDNPTLSNSSGTGLSLGSNVFVWTITNAACPPSISSVTITVIDCEPSTLIIPNVFTPNGDGFNDLFTVEGTNLASVEGQIFNRWGQLMFSWDNVKGSWDGRTLAGSEAPDGTYFYIITAVGNDGTEWLEKGGFSLIR